MGPKAATYGVCPYWANHFISLSLFPYFFIFLFFYFSSLFIFFSNIFIEV